MNRAERNAIREATNTIEALTEKVELLKRQNASLKGQLTKAKNTKEGSS